MDILKQLNCAATYLENHLTEPLDMNALAEIVCTTPESFSRFFSYITGVTLHEYIRRRRLTKAAIELQETNQRIIDIAVKYGYDSADAFGKAFSKQHGISPSKARNPQQTLRIYPPVSFQITVKGAEGMEMKIIETQDIQLKGISRTFTGPAKDRWEQENDMWMAENITQHPGYHKWFGIWNQGCFAIAKQENSFEDTDTDLEDLTIPNGTYAVFDSGFCQYAGTALPRLREQIFDCWLPDSEYEQIGDYEVAVYHLYPGSERDKRHFELWIPVRKKG